MAENRRLEDRWRGTGALGGDQLEMIRLEVDLSRDVLRGRPAGRPMERRDQPQRRGVRLVRV